MAPFETATLALRATAPTCPTTLTCPQDNSCTYLSSGVSLQVNCASDYYGGDLQLVQASTLVGCMRACAATDKCDGASYRGRDCYMKSVLNAAEVDEGVVGVVVVSREPAPTPSPPATPSACPIAFTCPDNDGCTIRGVNSQVYALSCGTDYYGGDFTSMWVESLPTCAQACADSDLCVAASFGDGKGAGMCYLKNKNHGAGVSENTNAVAIDSRVVPSPSATPSTSSSAIASSSASSVTSSSTSFASTPTSVGTTTSSTPAPTSVSTPVPTQVIINGDFEANSYTPWSFTGFALASGTVTGQSNTNAYNGERSFQAQGESANNYWLMEMSQTVTVLPGQAYNVSVWSKQAIYGNCDVTVNYNGASLFGFQPGTSYAEDTGRVAAGMTTGAECELRLSIQCGRGGSQARLWLDDVRMTQV
ncbi:uncharacterized protein M421DRAFT_173272 [Didymella exigua CBS 183.55]|uniref:Apple domain-containing protein n=1 Tax=Didymella exigua CBS 183.55 TaxID=1150837 RepID=A0A6A5RK98_9PLEO|nr:uncharacterized protein M421DRAFT_173272 [Didymella exigua CBS 183.55]KAF1927690.1 hypothetical protein M421DRAFT_173272 [Didymella exigua CBS 183.55]